MGQDTDENTERPPISNAQGLEQEFKNWQTETKGNSQGTAETYWNRLKDFPYFDLNHWSRKPYHEIEIDIESIKEENSTAEEEEMGEDPDLVEVLHGLITGELEDSHQKSTIYVYLRFLLHQYEEDPSISDREVSQITKKRAQLHNMLKEKDFDNNNEPSIDEHYLHNNQLVDLLKAAEPDRARYWTLLYFLGCRYGEFKKLEIDDLYSRDQSEDPFGHLFIPDEKAKRKGRRITFRNPLTYKLLLNSPIGEYRKDGETYGNAFYPDRKNDNENYQLGRERKRSDGSKVIYGLLGKIESISGTRTIHSFRHMRITDLVNDDKQFPDLSKDDVRKRAGHSNMEQTSDYEETSLRRKPRSLEHYIEDEFDGDYDRFRKEVIQYSGGVE